MILQKTGVMALQTLSKRSQTVTVKVWPAQVLLLGEGNGRISASQAEQTTLLTTLETPI